MQFLKTLFWVLLAVIIVLFARGNWTDARLNLWGDIQVDIKLPVLMALMFLLGFLPVFLFQRTRLWAMRRRLEADQRQQSIAAHAEPAEDSAAAI